MKWCWWVLPEQHQQADCAVDGDHDEAKERSGHDRCCTVERGVDLHVQTDGEKVWFISTACQRSAFSKSVP